jgi:hypothetical protein
VILRKTLVVSALLAVVLGTSSCGSMRRAGKDLGIVAVSPLLIPYGGFTDGFSSAQAIANGMGAGAATEVLVMPFTASWHLVKHALLGVVHAVDFVFLPIYGAAELHPYGPEIEPLDYYTGTIFDRAEDKSGTDAETGEKVEGER